MRERAKGFIMRPGSAEKWPEHERKTMYEGAGMSARRACTECSKFSSTCLFHNYRNPLPFFRSEARQLRDFKGENTPNHLRRPLKGFLRTKPRIRTFAENFGSQCRLHRYLASQPKVVLKWEEIANDLAGPSVNQMRPR